MSGEEIRIRTEIMHEGMRRLRACLEHGLDAPHNDDCKGDDESFWERIRELPAVPA